MKFGERVRELRKAKNWSLRELSGLVGVGFTYLSRVENERLNYGDYPSEALISRLAEALEADEEELLILARKIPEWVRGRILARPDAFLRIAALDDKTIDRILVEVGPSNPSRDCP